MTTILRTAPSRNHFASTMDSPGSRMAMVPEHPPSPRSNNAQTTSPTATNMGPPGPTSPDNDNSSVDGNQGSGESKNQANAAAAGSSSGPKVVQTAFIHKLYSMLEDRSIQHLISWSSTNESFVMSPSSDFSKVLAQYFKHTNISSFVRQLNMYGFHKVSDVFHTGSPESALWEFKHGNGSFKKGDLMGLREIKRRASKVHLPHRESFANVKPAASQPGTPAEIVADPEQRLANLEHAFYDVNARLSRTEDSYALMNTRCQSLTDSLVRCHQWIQGLSGTLQSTVPAESSIYTEISSMQKDIAKQLEYIRGLDQLQDPMSNGRPSYFGSSNTLDPMSPRGFNYPDSRRSSIQFDTGYVGLRPPVPQIPPQFNPSPRRYDSISGTHTSPGFSRPALPPSVQNAHPLSAVETPYQPRRHTSHDIREHGWPPQSNGSPRGAHHPPPNWPPSSPNGPSHGEINIRDQLAKYEINGNRRPTISVHDSAPPPHGDGGAPTGLGVDNTPWSISSKFARSSGFEALSAPPTRRGSVASNVHSLLNPPDHGDRAGEEDGNDDRKRKRVQ